MLKEGDARRMSRPIVRIATTGIAVGMILMLASVAIVKGFQQEVRNKVIGFGSHIQVSSLTEGRNRETAKILFDPELQERLIALPGVNHAQVFAAKPGILETSTGLQGVIVKGVGPDYDWTYLRSVLTEGDIITRDSAGHPVPSVILSHYIANRLSAGIGDRVSLYFINNESDARQQNFTVQGMYRTDLEDFDRQYILADIGYIQKYSGWGLDVQILSDTACSHGFMAIGAVAFGGNGDYSFEWPGHNWGDEGPHYISPYCDTTFTVVVSDDFGTTPDTCSLVIDFIDDKSDEPCRPFVASLREGIPSERSYIGGYEILLNSYDQIFQANDHIIAAIPFDLHATRITELNPDIFTWLSMLDINVFIIILLMVAISIINMTSALLIIILERQPMIGTLKAFGMRDRSVMQVFLMNAAWIIGKGLLWGNGIGLLVLWIQDRTGLIRLDPANYYVDHVPVWMNVSTVLALNGGTMLVCLAALVIPALYITTIQPIKAIRFS